MRRVIRLAMMVFLGCGVLSAGETKPKSYPILSQEFANYLKTRVVTVDELLALVSTDKPTVYPWTYRPDASSSPVYQNPADVTLGQQSCLKVGKALAMDFYKNEGNFLKTFGVETYAVEVYDNSTGGFKAPHTMPSMFIDYTFTNNTIARSSKMEKIFRIELVIDPDRACRPPFDDYAAAEFVFDLLKNDPSVSEASKKTIEQIEKLSDGIYALRDFLKLFPKK